MSLESEAIFIDESGDPGLTEASISKGRYYVIGFVYCRSPAPMRKGLRRLLKRLHPRRYPPHLRELKFYLPKTDLLQTGYSEDELYRFEEHQPENRRRMIRVLNETCSGVYAAVCDKTKAFKGWTPERLGNFILAQTLVMNILPNIEVAHTPVIVFIRGASQRRRPRSSRSTSRTRTDTSGRWA